MRWEDMRRSDNVEESSGGSPIGFGGTGFRLGGGAIIVIIVVSLGERREETTRVRSTRQGHAGPLRIDKR